AEDGIRDFHVTGVQTCALPIYYRIDIIRVPLDAPEQAEVVGYARIFEGLPAAPGRGGRAFDETTAARFGRGPRGCHDLTAYPARSEERRAGHERRRRRVRC